ncbi:MAG: exodeoxyribonuclease VII large subunit, partial [Desulfobacterales bacterium]
KKPPVFLPSRIALITSPTGAVIHDMLNIMFRRYENIHVQIFPVRVQGNGPVEQIVDALELVNSQKGIDVVILARGGGSLEDFQAFNSESVARAIFKSQIPVVAAIGHETDYTIVDFVADLRAPTPSAAAELVVPVKNELKNRCGELSAALALKMLKTIENFRYHLHHNLSRLIHPKKRVQDFFLKLDDLCFRMNRLMTKSLQQNRERYEWKTEKLWANNPGKAIEQLRAAVTQTNINLLLFLKILVDRKRARLRELTSGLEAMNPMTILARGYSITRMIPGKSIVRDAALVPMNQQLEITLEKGKLTCRVEGKIIS